MAALHTLEDGSVVVETQLCYTETCVIIMTKAICQLYWLTSKDFVVVLAGSSLWISQKRTFGSHLCFRLTLQCYVLHMKLDRYTSFQKLFFS